MFEEIRTAADFMREKTRNVADYDQCRSIIQCRIKELFLRDPSAAIDEWIESFNYAREVEFDTVTEGAIFWNGIIEHRRFLFNLVAKYGEFLDNGEISIRTSEGDTDGNL